ncbi:MAG: hypothetical protein H7Y38_20525 [Armatimonadetes bacterium]|nr:hypothetical protein [Armatimonadota bacterium]
MARKTAVWLLVAVLCFVGSVPVGAAKVVPQDETAPVWRAKVETRFGANGAGEVFVNSRLVLRFRTASGGYSAFRRAEIAADRLGGAIAGGLSAGDIVADTATDRANPRLKGAGQIFASADKAEGRAAGVSPVLLVRGWASNLRTALGMPGIIASDKTILVPLGESRTVRLSGVATGDLQITSASGTIRVPETNDDTDAATKPAIVSLSGSKANTVWTIRGTSAGRDTLTFERGGASVSVAVRVQPYAGSFAPPKPVVVTGIGGAPVERVARYAAACALASATVTSGAVARVQTDSVSVAMPLAPGAQSAVTVPVTLTGQDMISVRRVVSVPVRNEALPRVPTDALMYSNDPERVTKYGTLFAARVPVSAPNAPGATRVLFHHQSALTANAAFVVELLNDSDAPATVHIVGSGEGPVRDTVWVGYRAASEFVRDYQADTGVIVQLPPKTRLPLLSTNLSPGHTVSGLMQVRPLSGVPPMVRVAAEQPGDARADAESWQTAPLLPAEYAPGTTTLAYPQSDNVYPKPLKQVAAPYEVGGAWAFVSFGHDPLEATQGDKRLLGNYGVFYEVTATAHNGSDKPAKVRAVFVPTAGLAGGVFLVDGKYVEVPQTNLPKEPTLASYMLEPGETRIIRITTLPLSGSNYPARIVIRP